MAKIIRKKKKLNYQNIAKVLFVIALVASLGKSLFIRTMNNSLVMKIEDINRESTALKSENDKLSLEIQNLVSKDRVYDIATAAGLSQNQNNVINVVDGE